MEMPGSYTRIKAKCCDCQLHFVLCTWYPQRHNRSTLYCPECGQQSGRFVVYCEGVSGPIYAEVPGNAKLVQMSTQYPSPNRASSTELLSPDCLYDEKPNGAPQPWYSRIPIAQTIAIVMLAWAHYPHNPYDYYILLRFVVCGISTYLAYKAFELNRTGWVWALSIIAVIYNPILRVHLDRELWTVINVATMLVFVMSMWTLSDRIRRPKF